jgi:hypothetical protein
MKILFPLLLALGVAGCYADQQQAVSKCALQELEKNMSGPQQKAHTIMCMSAEGYELAAAKDCDLTDALGAIGPQCFVPMGRIQRAIFDFEMKYKTQLDALVP